MYTIKHIPTIILYKVLGMSSTYVKDFQNGVSQEPNKLTVKLVLLVLLLVYSASGFSNM